MSEKTGSLSHGWIANSGVLGGLRSSGGVRLRAFPPGQRQEFSKRADSVSPSELLINGSLHNHQ
jgi:hypothetical protein